MPANEGSNNLHSGPDFFFHRLWKLVSHTESAVTLELTSPNGDQGFPGNAVIQVTYALKADGALHILYKAACDQDTVFNFTNHSYFNLAGHDRTGRAMEQLLTIPGRFFNPDDAENIPTGELRPVAGTPMDFRAPKPIGQDIGADYEPLKLQGGYDHNWEVFCNPCATLSDPVSGRSMSVCTDCPAFAVRGQLLRRDRQGRRTLRQALRRGAGDPVLPRQSPPSRWPQPITRAVRPTAARR